MDRFGKLENSNSFIFYKSLFFNTPTKGSCKKIRLRTKMFRDILKDCEISWEIPRVLRRMGVGEHRVGMDPRFGIASSKTHLHQTGGRAGAFAYEGMALYCHPS